MTRDAAGWGPRHALQAAGLWLVLTAAVVLIARAAVAVQPDLAAGGLSAPLLYSVSLAIYLLMPLALGLTVARHGGWRSISGLPLRPAHLPLVAGSFVIGMLGLIIVNLAVSGLSNTSENPQVAALSGGAALSGAQIAALWLLLAVVVPICEELVFRGVLQPLLVARLGAVGGVFAGALIFAAAHLLPTLIPGLFVSGLLLGLLRAVSGSIWPGVIYHGLQNSLALFAFAALLNGAGG